VAGGTEAGVQVTQDLEAAISVASIAELHFGVLVTDNPDERARRADRLAAVEATFDPLPISTEVARAWGRLSSAVTQRGATRDDDKSTSPSQPQQQSSRCHCSPTTSPISNSSLTWSTCACLRPLPASIRCLLGLQVGERQDQQRWAPARLRTQPLVGTPKLPLMPGVTFHDLGIAPERMSMCTRTTDLRSRAASSSSSTGRVHMPLPSIPA